jgi:putative protease
MPKKTRKTKPPRKTKKITRKPSKKTVRKPAKKKMAKKKPARKTARPARRPAAVKSVMTVKKPLPPMKPKAAPAVPMIPEQRVGVVTHYYSHLSVAVVKLDLGALQVGDTIHIKGHTTDFQQRVDSMQVEHQTIQRAEVGEEFGLKVSEHVREHDIVNKMIG